MRRVVVTCIGVISALGLNTAEFWAALREGRAGITPIESVDVSKLRFHNSTEVHGYDERAHFDDSEAHFLDRFSQFALIAAREAVSDARISRNTALRDRTAVVTGSCRGGQSTAGPAFSGL